MKWNLNLKNYVLFTHKDFLVENRSFWLIFVTNDNESLVIIGNHWYLFLRKINFYTVKKTIEAELYELNQIFVPMFLVIASLVH